jgi:hypothetical protein
MTTHNPDAALEARTSDTYVLPVISSRRGVIQALVLVGLLYGAAFAATGINRFSDGIVITLIAVLVLIATMPLLSVNNPITRLAIVAPFCAPIFIAAFTADETSLRLTLAAIGLEVLIFGFLFLQAGTAQVTVRGVQRRRLIATTYSFDEIQDVKPFKSVLGRVMKELGLGSTNVELLLFNWKTVRLNLDPARVEAFIDEVATNIDPSVQYDVFFLPQQGQTTSMPADSATPQEVKPMRRRGKKAKKLAAQQREAQKLPATRR